MATTPFSADSIFQDLANTLQRNADALNQNAIAVYNTDVANATLNRAQPPTPPTLTIVDANLFYSIISNANFTVASYAQAVQQAITAQVYVPPAVVVSVTPVDTDPVGAYMGNGYYACTDAGKSYPDGHQLTTPMGVMIKHVQQSPFAPNGVHYWTIAQAAAA